MTPNMQAPSWRTALDAFYAAVRTTPDGPAILYFDGRMSYRELDSASDALAMRLSAGGVRPGDRLALYLQNTPGFVIALLAGWKAGAVPVPVNPMNRQRELSMLLADCTPVAMVCQDTLFHEVVADLPVRPPLIVTTSARDFQARNDRRLFTQGDAAASSMPNLAAIVASGGDAAASPGLPTAPEDIAFIVYTSGTTGAPKGSISTHAAAMHSAIGMVTVLGLVPGEPILGMAPLFHITGLVCQVLSAFALAAPLILSYRFEAGVMLDAIAEHRPTFSIGAITAYVAMMNHPDAKPDSFDPIRLVYSGGAPVPASVVVQFQERFGKTLRNGFGMTETNAPVIVTPPDQPSKVDPASQALSVGKAMPGLAVSVVAEDGRRLPAGEVGELILASPSLTSGYWNKPEETAAALTADGLRTGDVGFVDADGWIFLIDRKKDMISASGYKVWPRDVEDVLYMHPSVREAAVIGVPDPYRGETVKAIVSLKPGQVVDAEELIAFCRERMAAYKYPRVIDLVPDLPKTPTGKIMRRALREGARLAGADPAQE
jgi:long-chain acyl-CoA synthetase